MSWSTELFCNITFNRETFNSKREVEDKIEEFEACLQNTKDHLRNLLTMTELGKFCPENYDPLIWMRNEYRDSMDLIEEYSIELYKLNLLISNWDACHNKEGLAINPPEDIKWDSAYLSGDFVNSVKYPNANRVL